ncbi:MAG: hypothetical protein ACYTG0_33840, partial [Planctomycetota bacterium]
MAGDTNGSTGQVRRAESEPEGDDRRADDDGARPERPESRAVADPPPPTQPLPRAKPFRPLPPPRASQTGPSVPRFTSYPDGDAAAGRVGRRGLSRRVTSSWLVSCVVHATLLLTLGLIAISVPTVLPHRHLVAHVTDVLAEDKLLVEVPREIDPSRLRWTPGAEAVVEPHVVVPGVAIPLDRMVTADGTPGPGDGLRSPQPADWLTPIGASLPGGLGGRRGELRARLLEEGGGTPESEEAIRRGLRWLFTYQREDGSWNFNHNVGRQAGFSANPGNVASTTGATAIALAPFLGAGYTHQEGEYRETVEKGLYYLASRGLVTPNGVDLREGTMYAQGLAT